MFFVPGFAADPISECLSITRRVKDGLRPPLARWPTAILDPAPDREKISANIGAAARGVARANETYKADVESWQGPLASAGRAAGAARRRRVETNTALFPAEGVEA
ncbi:hypothetical protein GCM10010197_42150 [Nocardioides luteus]|uniref:Uncharacterized protein n=1 Tax=Nocardioides luteus TaxID=1844 RepID=A0ABQ5SVW4_9ACTN|nr:hypothetical protein GCM10010197_42150 [Nocardioides luteus]GLJ67743.1 hypothetical protein GCM10017579_17790 [Nocardioides luteus]